MRIGIVITSQTGNTRRVARELKDALAAAGHAVACEEIQRMQPRRPRAPFTRGLAPDPSAYDRLVFGGAVEAFALSPGLVAFVDALPCCTQRVVELVTQGLPLRAASAGGTV